MKKAFFILLVAACACTGQQEKHLSMKIDGIGNDTLFITSTPVADRFQAKKDTLIAENGTATYLNDKKELQDIRVSVKVENGFRSISFPMFPGEDLNLSGSLDEYRLSGNEFYSSYQEYLDVIRPMELAMEKTLARVTQLQKEKAPSDSIMKAYDPARTLSVSMTQTTFSFIKSHPDSDVSVWLLQKISLKQSESAMELLTERAKTGKMAAVYTAQKSRIEQETKRREAAKSIVEGAVAPEFTGKNIAGEKISLSDFKGKYVVVDFWGTWCGWCIKGMPGMKQLYETAKEKVEFIGIACNDPEDRWRDKVQELELPWVNILNNTKDDITVKYGVSAYPTKFILDPEGKVVLKVVGERPEFYEFIENIM